VDVRTLPELESITKIISTVRQKIPRKEDHWSVGASTIHNISAEATADLIKISKWCLVVGRDFTIREAKWADKLRGTVPFSKLLYVAASYAVEEQVAQALDEVTDTTSLDFYMLCFPDDTVMGNKVQLDSRLSGLMPKEMTTRLPREREKGQYDRLDPDVIRMEEPVSKVIEKLSGSYWVHEQELSEDADALYALWLRKLSEGPQWDHLSADSREEVARLLFAEVQALNKNAESHVPWMVRFTEVMSWKPPPDLLDKAGINPDSLRNNTNETEGG